MSARAGDPYALTVIENPNPADYQLNEGEQLLMVIPSQQPAPRAMARPETRLPAGGFSPANLPPVTSEVRTEDAQSEVANETFRRRSGEKSPPPEADERIPWWKGGLWRNKDDEPQPAPRNDPPPSRQRRTPPPEDDPVAARRNRDANTARRPAPRAEEDDLWGDSGGEYTGYNPDGSFGRPAPAAAPYDPYAPFDPYAPQQPPAYDPYAQQGGYVSPPFTDPNAPLGAYADPYAAPYADPYAAAPYAGGSATSLYDPNAYSYVPTIDAATGQPIGPGAGTPYPADPYAAPADSGMYTFDSTGYGAAGMIQPDPFSALPAQAPGDYAASTDYASMGGPQFENAVRMVKENRFTEAKAILASETARNPANAAAWRWLADCHYNLLELDDAILCYQRSLERDHGDYYALRGQGFSYLHRGHEYWRRMQEEVAQNRKDEAAATFSLAHDDYKKALEMLGLCLRRAPNDGEAIYGEAMAAEGASRKLYSNAISYLKLGPDQRERAELFAENCLTVINKGIERSRERSRQVPGDSGPRALLGGLYLRKATLYHQLGKNDLALIELRNARDVQRSILDEIDKNNATAQRAVQEAEALWEQWGGDR